MTAPQDPVEGEPSANWHPQWQYAPPPGPVYAIPQAPSKPREGLAVAALVLGILAVVSAGWFIPGAVLAVVFGAIAWHNGAKAKWGFWLGIVALAAFVLWLVAIVNSTDNRYRNLTSNAVGANPVGVDSVAADEAFDTTLSAFGIDTSGIPDTHMLAHAVCADVSAGTTSVDEASAVAATWNLDDLAAGELVGAAEGAYCPQNLGR